MRVHETKTMPVLVGETILEEDEKSSTTSSIDPIIRWDAFSRNRNGLNYLTDIKCSFFFSTNLKTYKFKFHFLPFISNQMLIIFIKEWANPGHLFI